MGGLLEKSDRNHHLMLGGICKERMPPLGLLCLLIGFPQNSCTHLHGGLKSWESTVEEITGYAGVAQKIIDLAVYGDARNRSYEKLANFTDAVGNRLSGSKNLERAIDYMYNALKQDGLDNVHLEAVKIPHWVRGEESAMMVEPRHYKLAILGLGSSVATPVGGIEAEVLVVQSFDELKQRASEAKGKIVMYNQPFVSYEETAEYRAKGASEAAKVGALASLIRSVTPFSINSPHTGWQDYEEGVIQIPAACITLEDAQMMARIAQRGQRIVIRLTMSAQTLPDADSFNTVAEITGSKYPEQVVLISGHLDSWDVGHGAMDDGGGVAISWEALSLLKDLGLRPKRTVRAVLWSAEEPGGVGAKQYYERHKANISNFNIVMESDMGTFRPQGFQFSGKPKALRIMAEVMKLLQPINATKLEEPAEGTDIQMWMDAGVPGGSLLTENSKYFWFHHTHGDTMAVQDPVEMNLCSAVWAILSYVIADLDEMLPR
ncbi:hypothetical protein AAFF_G00403010 [Aldrovandia affinis]|uniref:Carboxypeptidase Q n=1 Tax=Aldrovandia affinis TaxID=143900 RepID=A0AAD7T7D4_9TELE|nr:hypothetical protein AAFF_G00403010 [Aldrovandia affinis]